MKKNLQSSLPDQLKFRYGLILFVVSVAIYFLPFTLQGLTLSGDDFKYPGENFFLNFSKLWSSSWTDHLFLGRAFGNTSLNIPGLILLFFPAQIASSLIYVLAVFLVFVGCFLLLRNLNFSSVVSIFSAWIVSFSPVFFSYIRTGHIGKMYALGFFFLTFAFTLKMIKANRIVWSDILFNAVFLSFGFIAGAVQTYLYLVLVYIAFIFFYLTIGQGHSFSVVLWKRKKSILSLALSGCFAFIFAYYSIISQFRALTGWSSSAPAGPNYVPVLSEEEKPQPKMTEVQRWYWATQWSLPKQETLDFLVPGIFGFLSGDSENPYWGKVGQTEGWEKHRQGYRNYSLASNYLGIFLVCFLVYALFKVPRSIRFFWGGISLLLLLLSYGKFFFVYEWFYQIPSMEKLRNPNKFILVLYLTLGVLACYGVQHYYLRLKENFSKTSLKRQPNSQENFFLIFLIVSSVILGLGLLWVTVQKNILLLHFASFYSLGEAKTVVANIQNYLMRGILVFTLVNLCLYLIPRLTKKQLPWSVVFILFFGFFDLYQVNQKFLNTVPIPKHQPEDETDPIARFLIKEKKSRPYRVKVAERGQYLNYFMWNLTLKNQIDTIDYLALREGLPDNFKAYFGKLNHNLKYYRLANVDYILTQQPIDHPLLEYVFYQDYTGVKEKVFVYRLKKSLKRIYLRGSYETGYDVETILGRMNQFDFDIDQTVMIHQEIAQNPQYELETVKSSPSSLRLKSFSPTKYEVEVSVATPTILVLGNYFHPGWVAYDQNHQPLKHFHVNYFYNGYLVKPEMKQISLVFESGNLKDYLKRLPIIFRISVFVVLLILLGLAWRRREV